MKILAVDPGSVQSGIVVWEHGAVVHADVIPNHAVLGWLGGAWPHHTLAIEMMKARGMPVSNDEMETLVWVGRFVQKWRDPDAARLVYRADVKMHVCGSARANDKNIRAALLDKVGPRGTKRAPGPTYLVTSHSWAALAVAVTLSETQP